MEPARHAGTEAATDPDPADSLTRMLLWDPAVTDPAWLAALRWAAAAAVYLTLGIGAAWPSRPPHDSGVQSLAMAAARRASGTSV